MKETIKIDPDKLTMYFGREGLHIDQSGRELAVVDITAISLLGIEYGSNLDIHPAGWFISPRQKILNWLKNKA